MRTADRVETNGYKKNPQEVTLLCFFIGFAGHAEEIQRTLRVVTYNN